MNITETLDAIMGSVEKMTGPEIESRLAELGETVEKRGGELTAEHLESMDKAVDALKERRSALIEAEKKRGALLENISEGRTGGGANVLSRFKSREAGGADGDADPFGTMEYRRAFMNHVCKGAPMPREFRSLEGTTFTTDVGSVIPTPVLNRIIEQMESVGMILPLVTRTAHKGGLRIPTSSVKPVASWVAEGAGSPRQKKPTGEISFLYHKLRCAVAVTLEVDTMAMPVFEAALINNVVEAMVWAIEEAIINGTGTGQPKGILTETPEKGQTLNIQSLTYQDVLDAEAALPMAYEGNTRWCMTKQTFYQFQAIKNDIGTPIAHHNFSISGRAERVLLGRPVTLCDYMPSFGPKLPAGTPFAFMFNFRDYILNTNLNMGIKRFEDNETDDFVTRAVTLVDGKVVAPWSLVLLVKKS